MKNLLRFGFILALLFISISLFAQSTNNRFLIEKGSKAFGLENKGENSSQQLNYSSFPTSPLSALVSVPGAVDIGISGKYHTQTGRGGLHNIQVDPDNPQKIHVVVMTALNVKNSDTTTANNYPQRNIYYTYSADGGITWKAAKKVAPFRAGFAAMILYKRNGVYVPIIAAHRYTNDVSKQFISALYVEKGAPGDGTFEEAAADMTTAEGDTREILWPSIAVSTDNTKVYMISSTNRTTTSDPLYHLQFTTFTLDDQGTPTFTGWKQGPSYDLDNGLTTGGNYMINVSKSGKIGIIWQAYDFGTPDRGLYLSESTNGGTTWSSAITVYYPAATQTTGGNINFDPSGLDFFYDNDEKANVVINAYYELGTETQNTYLPATGSILFWKQGMTVPIYVIGRNSDNDLGAPVLDGSWLSDWANNLGIDPQGANLEYPTIARGADKDKFSIFFEAWAQDDNGTYLLPTPGSDGSDTNIIYPFHGIYRIDTKDGGLTFAAPVSIHTNTISDPQAQKKDYRFPEVSSFNPTDENGLRFALLFGADTAAGLSVPGYPGLPGFDDLQWFYETNLRSGVKSTSNSTLTLAQNFPNPFTATTAIPVELNNDDVVTVSVADMLGREVATIYHGRLSAGVHNIQFTAPNLGAGIYTYTLKTSEGSISRTMSLVR
jgi:hypothetical protein